MNVWALQFLPTLKLLDTLHHPCTKSREWHVILLPPHTPRSLFPPAFVAIPFYGLLQFARGMSSLVFTMTVIRFVPLTSCEWGSMRAGTKYCDEKVLAERLLWGYVDRHSAGGVPRAGLWHSTVDKALLTAVWSRSYCSQNILAGVSRSPERALGSTRLQGWTECTLWVQKARLQGIEGTGSGRPSSQEKGGVPVYECPVHLVLAARRALESTGSKYREVRGLE